jgi:hypothetical protein
MGTNPLHDADYGSSCRSGGSQWIGRLHPGRADVAPSQSWQGWRGTDARSTREGFTKTLRQVSTLFRNTMSECRNATGNLYAPEPSFTRCTWNLKPPSY